MIYSERAKIPVVCSGRLHLRLGCVHAHTHTVHTHTLSKHAVQRGHKSNVICCVLGTALFKAAVCTSHGLLPGNIFSHYPSSLSSDNSETNDIFSLLAMKSDKSGSLLELDFSFPGYFKMTPLLPCSTWAFHVWLAPPLEAAILWSHPKPCVRIPNVSGGPGSYRTPI